MSNIIRRAFVDLLRSSFLQRRATRQFSSSDLMGSKIFFDEGVHFGMLSPDVARSSSNDFVENRRFPKFLKDAKLLTIELQIPMSDLFFRFLKMN